MAQRCSVAANLDESESVSRRHQFAVRVGQAEIGGLRPQRGHGRRGLGQRILLLVGFQKDQQVWRSLNKGQAARQQVVGLSDILQQLHGHAA